MKLTCGAIPNIILYIVFAKIDLPEENFIKDAKSQKSYDFCDYMPKSPLTFVILWLIYKTIYFLGGKVDIRPSTAVDTPPVFFARVWAITSYMVVSFTTMLLVTFSSKSRM